MPEAAARNTDALPPENPLEYVVRCGSMRILEVMASRDRYRYGDEVVVRSARGTELGTVLCEATPTSIDQMEESPPHETTRHETTRHETTRHETTQGRILRTVTDDDRRQWEQLSRKTATDLAACQRWVDQLGLKMQLIDIERILGGERIVVYYLAESRVDFRQLVRDLAKEFQARIEMRHIGVRDEAKLLADYGDCGQPICCATFLSKMPPVSMKMAKLQKATLDPSKISGRCGRLKCCLRYEFETYDELARQLPPGGSLVLTREGNATVLNQDILSQKLLVKTDDGRRIMIEHDDVIRVVRRGEDPENPRRGRTRRKK